MVVVVVVSDDHVVYSAGCLELREGTHKVVHIIQTALTSGAAVDAATARSTEVIKTSPEGLVNKSNYQSAAAAAAVASAVSGGGGVADGEP